jgi:hypothetical protein
MPSAPVAPNNRSKWGKKPVKRLSTFKPDYMSLILCGECGTDVSAGQWVRDQKGRKLHKICKRTIDAAAIRKAPAVAGRSLKN